MRSNALKLALEESEKLSQELLKIRNNSAFNKFINNKIDYSKHVIQPLTEDINLASVKNVHDKLQAEHSDLKTCKEESVIRTEEICNIPFPFVQTETLLYPDGTKIVTTFYPSAEKIPAKRVEYSAKTTITKTTTYDRNGNEKTLDRNFINVDGMYIEEYVDFKFSRKTIKRFNKNKIATSVESYVKDNLAFALEHDELGNIKRELTYYAFMPNRVLQKEIVYDEKGSYTQKEYNTLGVLTGVKTVCGNHMRRIS